jgi:hypothetical protein
MANAASKKAAAGTQAYTVGGSGDVLLYGLFVLATHRLDESFRKPFTCIACIPLDSTLRLTQPRFRWVMWGTRRTLDRQGIGSKLLSTISTHCQWHVYRLAVLDGMVRRGIATCADSGSTRWSAMVRLPGYCPRCHYASVSKSQ